MNEVADGELADAINELAAFASSGASDVEVRGRQFDLGLAWPTNPAGLGGRGLDNRAARVVDRELARHGLFNPPAGFVGPNLVAPMLVAHGSAEQQQTLLRPIFTRENRWCQLFSEPSAGSDLANVCTIAMRDGETWLVRGQKVWNSFAAEATHGILLTRSDPEVPKHRGMTMFLVDMSSPGIDVRPLRDMTGHAHFNEVFIDDLVVPDKARLGELHAGWGLALEVLRHERMAVGGGSGGGETGFGQDSRLGPLRDSGAASDPRIRDRYVRALINEKILGYSLGRLMAGMRTGKTTLNETVVRVIATEHNFEVLNLVLDARGAAGMLHSHGYARNGSTPDPADWDTVRDFLYARGLMIGGGTLEICRNQIGERALGLPPEPRIDKDGSWRETSGLKRSMT